MYLSLPPSLSFLHTYKLSFTRNTRHNIKAIDVYNFCNQIQKYEDIPTMWIVIIIVKILIFTIKKEKHNSEINLNVLMYLVCFEWLNNREGMNANKNGQVDIIVTSVISSYHH